VRIWDVAAGYLNRQSLLGEHRELHGLYRIHTLRLAGYARHPETIRWKRALSGLKQRHQQLAVEMALRGYIDRTPMAGRSRQIAWPSTFIDLPSRQFELLGRKYVDHGEGRVPLPRSAAAIWAQHKYSVMARDVEAYRTIGRRVARLRRGSGFEALALELTLFLRDVPPPARCANAVEHMWGYVSKLATAPQRAHASSSPRWMLHLTQAMAIAHRQPYLLSSTALSELTLFV
jgi:hypothetical protein